MTSPFKPAMTKAEATTICASANIRLVEYSGKGRAKSQLECISCGHQWEAPLLNIKRGSRCPVCSKSQTTQANPTDTVPIFTEEEIAILNTIVIERFIRNEYLESISKANAIAKECTRRRIELTEQRRQRT